MNASPISFLVLAGVGVAALPSSATAADLDPVAAFGDNPGALLMYEHAPAALPAGAPLVVVLHGCTQSARDMLAAGWNDLADELGFAVVYAEQPTVNNPVGCFNWAGEYGDPANMVRGQGENASILSMIDHAIATHGIDPARVYVTGFSAGGAFTAVMLATWPDRIAAGAIQSGVPYRCATSVQTAYDCQQLDLHPERGKTGAEWAALVEAAADGNGARWPRVAIWHGTTDGIVDPVAAAEQLEQWTAVHRIDGATPVVDAVGGHQRVRYLRDGVAVVESWTITGMGHAVALGAADPEGACSGAAAYYEDRGVCSTRRIAHFFGLFPDDGGEPGAPDAGLGAGGDDDGECSCGCAASPDGSALAGVAAVLLLVAFRRRRCCR